MASINCRIAIGYAGDTPVKRAYVNCGLFLAAVTNWLDRLVPSVSRLRLTASKLVSER
jgi:hypothetical protein